MIIKIEVDKITNVKFAVDEEMHTPISFLNAAISILRTKNKFSSNTHIEMYAWRDIMDYLDKKDMETGLLPLYSQKLRTLKASNHHSLTARSERFIMHLYNRTE
jgi:hypothetical protein